MSTLHDPGRWGTGSSAPWKTTPEDERRFYETLIESSPTAIAVGDPDLIIRAWNPAAERLFGYAAGED